MSEKPLRIAAWMVPILLVGLIAAVEVKSRVDDKESVVDHNRDITVTQQSVMAVQSSAREQTIRDSARFETFFQMMSDLHDELCAQHPTRRHCGEKP